MHSELDDMQAKLDVLTQALDGQNAGEIIAATEALATAAILVRNAAVVPGQEARARSLIGKTLAQLEAAAIRVNILKNWTRQRIDRNHEIRGMTQRGPATTY